MESTEWIATPNPGVDALFLDGTPVQRTNTVTDPGRRGKIVGWAVGRDAQVRYMATKNPEYLIDNEGPLVRWDDQDPADESFSWFPGQSMVCIRNADLSEGTE